MTECLSGTVQSLLAQIKDLSNTVKQLAAKIYVLEKLQSSTVTSNSPKTMATSVKQKFIITNQIPELFTNIHENKSAHADTRELFTIFKKTSKIILGLIPFLECTVKIYLPQMQIMAFLQRFDMSWKR